MGPVEAMRRRADHIQGEELDERLPLPPADDEVRRLGETLNAMLARLEQAFERERTFVADASHELRTPLAIMKTELDLALRSSRSAEELREALMSAAEETDRLSQLAEDLLVIARADQGALPVRLERVSVADPAQPGLPPLRGARRRGRAGGSWSTLPPASRAELDQLRIEQAVATSSTTRSITATGTCG